MLQAQFEIQLIASMVAVACALPGVFLVLRRMAMMSDAISHTVLLGIVIAFFITKSLNSPLLLIGAALMGVITVSLVELLNRTRLVREDASIGLVFPAIFSIAVILISRFAGDVHLDTDAVLLGELAFAPFNRLRLFGLDFGPEALYTTGGILVLNILFIVLLYKELKLATFDPALAAALGFAPAFIHYALMALVSLTAVGAFDAVGSVLVVAFMIAPPAAAYMLTDRLSRMLLYSALIGIFSAVSGYWLAHWLDASIAGSMAGMTGVSFLAAYLLAPERGLIAQARRRQTQRIQFALTMLTMHIAHHTATQEAEQENQVTRLNEHLKWSPQFATEIVGIAERNGLVQQKKGLLFLTESGVKRSQQEFTT
ncbi:MAG TPA: metal ABC transporter permease [Anaerolineales bacterium]|nr:metal ABC transporter permease [Anaerolineales bacterium]